MGRSPGRFSPADSRTFTEPAMQRPAFGRGTEKRRTARRPGATRGILAFNKSTAAVACVVRDFSRMGARVQMQEKVTAPDIVFLVFPDIDHAYQANVSWQRETSLGLKFTGKFDL